MSVWNILHKSGGRSLADWGIENPKLTFCSLDNDTLTFEMPVSSINNTPPFLFGDKIELFKDGVRWFSGTVTALTSIGTVKRDAILYTISGPWWQLENLIFQDYMMTPVDPTNMASALQPLYSSYTVLFQDNFGNARKNGDQITLTLNYALSKGANLVVGTIDPNIYVPNEEAHDLSCADVIRRCCAWTPDVVSHFDYSAWPPTLNFKKRAHLVNVSFDLNGGFIIQSPKFNPRYDLKPAGIKIYIQHTSRYVNGTARSWYEVQTAGSGDDGIGCIVMTIPLSANGTGEEKVPVTILSGTPTTLAQALYASLSTLHYEGDLLTKEQECSGILRPGCVVNLSNGPAAWATMNALVQTVTEELVTGETTTHCGPPTQLSLQDLITLAAAAQSAANKTGLAAGRSTAGGTVASIASTLM